ncbi:MAG: hypothetical protein Q7R79_00780 [bacterium]|nr:hypothetical protein [bacterium]
MSVRAKKILIAWLGFIFFYALFFMLYLARGGQRFGVTTAIVDAIFSLIVSIAIYFSKDTVRLIEGKFLRHPDSFIFLRRTKHARLYLIINLVTWVGGIVLLIFTNPFVGLGFVVAGYIVAAVVNKLRLAQVTEEERWVNQEVNQAIRRGLRRASWILAILFIVLLIYMIFLIPYNN